MNNAILLHGKPSKEEYYDTDAPCGSNHHWFPWLQKQLIARDIHAQTPEVPEAWKPYYPLWCKEFERYDITPETILVGHSCGGGFLVRWLSEHPDVQVHKVILVAPSIGKGWVEDDFFEFSIDAGLVGRTTKGVTIFVSDDDKPGIADAVQMLTEAIDGISLREFHGYGHFTRGSMGTTAFPELLDAVIA